VRKRGGIAAVISSAFGFAAIAVLAGCGAVGDSSKAEVNDPTAGNGEAPAGTSNEGTRVITNLSQLSSAPAAIPAANAQALVSGAAKLHHQTTPSPLSAQDLADANLAHMLRSKTDSGIHGCEVRAAGDRTLLNAKAKKFPEFSYDLLNQTLVAAQKLEPGRLEGRKLPDEIKPMILSAVMTPEGKLTDIAIEQHSGMGTVDRIIVDACKQGLWAMNPPPGALANDGKYRMRIEGAVNNYDQTLKGKFHYITHLGLALL
jgi:hypothetical protein